MLRALVNLHALTVLARLELDLSVRSALRVIVATAAVILGVVLALASRLHSLGGPGPILIGQDRADRVVLTLAVLWVATGVFTYTATRSWIAEDAVNASGSEEFVLRALLGADVLSRALAERLTNALFSVLLLMIVSMGSLFHASMADILLLIIGSGVGTYLYCQAGRETLAYIARPERKSRDSPILRMLTPLCLALVVATGVLGWRSTAWGSQDAGGDIHVPLEFVITAGCLSAVMAAVALMRLANAVRAMRGHPLGLPVAHVSLPITMRKNRLLAPYARTAARLFVAHPLLSGLVATRWPLALAVVVTAVDIPQGGPNMAWFAAFTLVSTMQTVSTNPDLLLGGRALRFYYEEKGAFPMIFAAALLTRTLVVLPQAGVMIALWRLVGGGAGGEVFILAALAVIGDIAASGLAGSSNQPVSQYNIMMSALVSFVVTAVGTALLGVAPAATVALAISLLFLAYTTWRKNVAYATQH